MKFKEGDLVRLSAKTNSNKGLEKIGIHFSQDKFLDKEFEIDSIEGAVIEAEGCFFYEDELELSSQPVEETKPKTVKDVILDIEQIMAMNHIPLDERIINIEYFEPDGIYVSLFEVGIDLRIVNDTVVVDSSIEMDFDTLNTVSKVASYLNENRETFNMSND